MASARRLTAEERQIVIDEIRRTFGTAEFSTRKVGKVCGVSEGTVRNIAKSIGMPSCAPDEASREGVKNAIEQAKLNSAARRTSLASRLLDVAERALDDMGRSALVFNFGGKNNTYAERVIEKPTFADQRNLMIIAATAIDKHRILDQYDAVAARASAFDQWLETMAG